MTLYCILTVNCGLFKAEALPIATSDYDTLCPREDTDVGLEPAVDMDQKSIPGTSPVQVFEMTAILDQQSKVHICGEHIVYFVPAWNL